MVVPSLSEELNFVNLLTQSLEASLDEQTLNSVGVYQPPHWQRCDCTVWSGPVQLVS